MPVSYYNELYSEDFSHPILTLKLAHLPEEGLLCLTLFLAYLTGYLTTVITPPIISHVFCNP